MKCYQCGGAYEAMSDSLEIYDFYVGRIEVHGVPYYQCSTCHDILYTEEMCRALETQKNTRIAQLLGEFRLADFVSSSQAASILGISRQALHKHRRIRHGFIYRSTFAGITLYLRQSVLRFRRTGDGRFPLQSRRLSHALEYPKGPIPNVVPVSYESNPEPTWPSNPFLEKQRVSPKEHSYAD